MPYVPPSKASYSSALPFCCYHPQVGSRSGGVEADIDLGWVALVPLVIMVEVLVVMVVEVIASLCWRNVGSHSSSRDSAWQWLGDDHCTPRTHALIPASRTHLYSSLMTVLNSLVLLLEDNFDEVMSVLLDDSFPEAVTPIQQQPYFLLINISIYQKQLITQHIHTVIRTSLNPIMTALIPVLVDDSSVRPGFSDHMSCVIIFGEHIVDFFCWTLAGSPPLEMTRLKLTFHPTTPPTPSTLLTRVGFTRPHFVDPGLVFLPR